MSKSKKKPIKRLLKSFRIAETQWRAIYNRDVPCSQRLSGHTFDDLRVKVIECLEESFSIIYLYVKLKVESTWSASILKDMNTMMAKSIGLILRSLERLQLKIQGRKLQSLHFKSVPR